MSAGVSPELGQIGVPSAPRITALSTAERRIELTWEPDASGALPRQFVVRGGLRGQPATIPLATLGAEARVWRSEAVPAGEYVIALVATNAAGESAPAQLDVGIETPGAAEPPAGLIALKAGRSAAELTWQPPTSGPLPTGYLIEAAPEGGPFVPAITTTLPELFVSGIPAGVWSVRVRALTVDGPGAPSELAVIDGTTCVPATDAPRALAGLVDGSRATLQWEAPASGPAASYRVHLASDASSANTIATFLVDGASTSFETTAPAGIYAVRVSAESQCATSALSNPVVLRVP